MAEFTITINMKVWIKISGSEISLEKFKEAIIVDIWNGFYKSMKQMGIVVGAVKNGSNGGCSGCYDKIGVKIINT